MCQVHKYLVCGTLTLWETHHSSGWLSFVKLVMDTDNPNTLYESQQAMTCPTCVYVLNLMEH